MAQHSPKSTLRSLCLIFNMGVFAALLAYGCWGLAVKRSVDGGDLLAVVVGVVACPVCWRAIRADEKQTN